MLFHPVLDKDIIGKTCLYCGIKLSIMKDVLFCPACNHVFIKDKDNGTTPDNVVPANPSISC